MAWSSNKGNSNGIWMRFQPWWNEVSPQQVKNNRKKSEFLRLQVPEKRGRKRKLSDVFSQKMVKRELKKRKSTPKKVAKRLSDSPRFPGTISRSLIYERMKVKGKRKGKWQIYSSSICFLKMVISWASMRKRFLKRLHWEILTSKSGWPLLRMDQFWMEVPSVASHFQTIGKSEKRSLVFSTTSLGGLIQAVRRTASITISGRRTNLQKFWMWINTHRISWTFVEFVILQG